MGSARLHLSDRLPRLQAELDARLAIGIRALQASGLQLTGAEHSPIFQAQCDSPRIAFAVAERLKARGSYACVCVFPAVPMNRPGIRLTITRHNELSDIEPFIAVLAECFESVRNELSRERGGTSWYGKESRGVAV